MKPTLLIIEADAARPATMASLPLAPFSIRFTDGVGTGWEDQCSDPADVILLGRGIQRDTAMTFVARLRDQFPTTIGLVASGDCAIDSQILRLALEHADAIAELRRRSGTAARVAHFA